MEGDSSWHRYSGQWYLKNTIASDILPIFNLVGIYTKNPAETFNNNFLTAGSLKKDLHEIKVDLLVTNPYHEEVCIDFTSAPVGFYDGVNLPSMKENIFKKLEKKVVTSIPKERQEYRKKKPSCNLKEKIEERNRISLEGILKLLPVQSWYSKKEKLGKIFIYEPIFDSNMQETVKYSTSNDDTNNSKKSISDVLETENLPKNMYQLSLSSMEDSDILLEADSEESNVTLQIDGGEIKLNQINTENVTCAKKGPQAVLSFLFREVLQYEFVNLENTTTKQTHHSLTNTNNVQYVDIGLCILRYDFTFQKRGNKGDGAENFDVGNPQKKETDSNEYHFLIGNEKYTAICFTVERQLT